ncbi:hypothetical protein [Actinoplanes sp. NPDC051851]|uniref:hypothetical protein n=1 Tax=Actinoplanes sp. NPDC051851 TaxID=3154753 RepID=UPI003440587B
MLHRIRRLLAVSAAALLATTVLVGLAADPAQAQTYGSLPLLGWAYTDSADPSTPHPDPAGNFLIGTRTDTAGTAHTGRAYFTYDITGMRDQVLHRVTFYTYERTVDDCTKVAPIQMWRTTPVTAATTWDDAPEERELLGERSYGSGVICPGAYLDVDMIPAVQAALARDETSITVEVRISATGEDAAGLARTMSKAAISYAVNHAPVVSGVKLRYPDAGCGTTEEPPPASKSVQFQATVTDADPSDYARIYYAYWPADRPDQRKETAYATPDLTGIADGTVIAWTAQGRDNDDAGAWADTCYFVLDTVAPATPPVVSSEKYPTTTYPGTGGPGVPGTFVFDADGDVDTVAFDWYEDALITRVVPDHPGGRAEAVVTPRYSGPKTLKVAAVDAAGNRTAWVEYRYLVRDTAPFAVFELNGVGLTSHITLSSSAAEVTGFGYAVDGGPEVRVPAVDRTGKGDLVFDSVGTKTVVERAYAGDEVIGVHTDQIGVSDAPKITSAEFSWSASPVAGRAGTFTFAPRTTDVVAYRYGFGDGNNQSVDAGADGTAELSWTPQEGGYYTIYVTSVDADGDVSEVGTSSFWVIDPHPVVSANTYGAQVGQPISVDAWSDLPDAVAIVYSFDGGPQQTVDGAWAWFEVVPTHAGDSDLVVWARLADGGLSPATTTVLHVSSAPAVTAQGPFSADAVELRPVTFTFTAAQAGAASFRYTVGSRYDGEEHPEHTVAAGADGTATVTYDVPAYWGDVTVTVASLTGDGTASDSAEFSVAVRNPRVAVTGSVSGAGVPAQFGFSGYELNEYTESFLWHVGDGAVQEVAYDPLAWETTVSYTPETAGAATLYVQRRFTDGSLSPITEFAFDVPAS